MANWDRLKCLSRGLRILLTFGKWVHYMSAEARNGWNPLTLKFSCNHALA